MDGSVALVTFPCTGRLGLGARAMDGGRSYVDQGTGALYIGTTVGGPFQ